MRFLLGLTALAGSILTAVPALALDSADVEQEAVALRPNGYVWPDKAAPAAAVPVTILISIADQRAYVYRGAALVAASTVSTGKAGKDTPVGTYQILQKKVDHKSNLYDDAAMPFMQRLTWDGIAIHAGKNPGFPNSHGCIRVPAAFAKKLYDATRLGTTVTVIDEPALVAEPAHLVPDDVYDGALAEAMTSDRIG